MGSPGTDGSNHLVVRRWRKSVAALGYSRIVTASAHSAGTKTVATVVERAEEV
jgi:hypothetical protein